MLTIPDVMERLAVSRETVQSWIERRELAAANVAPAGSKRKFYRVAETALADFLRRRSGQQPVAVPVATGNFLTRE